MFGISHISHPNLIDARPVTVIYLQDEVHEIPADYIVWLDKSGVDNGTYQIGWAEAIQNST